MAGINTLFADVLGLTKEPKLGVRRKVESTGQAFAMSLVHRPKSCKVEDIEAAARSGGGTVKATAPVEGGFGTLSYSESLAPEPAAKAVYEFLTREDTRQE